MALKGRQATILSQLLSGHCLNNNSLPASWEVGLCPRATSALLRPCPCKVGLSLSERVALPMQGGLPWLLEHPRGQPELVKAPPNGERRIHVSRLHDEVPMEGHYHLLLPPTLHCLVSQMFPTPSHPPHFP